MTGHWRKPLDYSDETLAQASAQVETFRNFFVESPPAGDPLEQERLAAALDDDFNTPDALALLHDWRSRGLAADLRAGLELFGLARSPTVRRLRPTWSSSPSSAQAARAAKDFAEADRLRDAIAELGWEARDAAGGSSSSGE